MRRRRPGSANCEKVITPEITQKIVQKIALKTLLAGGIFVDLQVTHF